ncbi:MAG: cyclase family protein [Actinobacteria bacterium]|nr:cyclase family protein [Actinomycetota bacterium]
MTLPEEFHDLARRVNNWGRWGDDDERGTLNLIDPHAVRRGVAAVSDGRRVSLSIALSEDGPQLGNIPGRVNPERRMIALHQGLGRDPDGIRFNDDAVSMPLQAATHWDALAHVSYAGRLYNGFPSDSVTEDGAEHLGIDRAGSIVTRGVLLDVAAAKGVDRLEPGSAIRPDDLSAAEDRAGVRLQPGDVALIRTGHIRLLDEGRKPEYSMGDAPGPGMECAGWFHERDLAAVATDTIAFEVWPLERKGVVFPLHLLDLVEMGMMQGQNFHLEGLAGDCDADGRYEFLLEASPLPFARGLGGPVHPVAVK